MRTIFKYILIVAAVAVAIVAIFFPSDDDVIVGDSHPDMEKSTEKKMNTKQPIDDAVIVE